ncbi:MAG TPA: DUF4249 domain-containing protein [Sphingobacteriaceae bacterium]
MINKNYLVLLAFALFQFSCENFVEVELADDEPQLVVNSFFNADSALKVSVTTNKLISTFNHNFETVENAVVELYQNHQNSGLLSNAGLGNYRFSDRLSDVTGTIYSLKVKAPGFETAEATEIMPPKPDITSFTNDPATGNSGSMYKSYKVKLTLKDIAEKTNFYFIRGWLIDKNNRKWPIYFSLNNNLGQFSPRSTASSEMYLFNDKSFNGQSAQLDLGPIQVYIPTDDAYSIAIELANTTESYYDYQYSVKKQVETTPVFGPESKPVSNNIKNGLGVFAIYNPATSTFNVK